MRRKTLAFLAGLALLGLIVFVAAIALTGNNSPTGLGRGPVQTTKVPTPEPTRVPTSHPKGNPFGALIPTPSITIQQQISIAQQLGIRYVRPAYPVFAEDPNLECAGCVDFTRAGFKLVLTVRNGPNAFAQIQSGGRFPPSHPPTDMGAYQDAIGKIIDMYRPALLVIENEENVPDHWSGTADQYGEMLKAACDVARQKKTKCTNGGTLSESVTYLVYESYVQQGETEKADSFANRAFADFQKRALSGPNGQADALMRAERTAPFLAAYADSGADYVNFHWYVSDPQAMQEAKQYMEGVTGLPAVINEMGQHDTNPGTTTAMLREAVDLGLPYVIWYMSDARLAKGLINPDGSLRPTGEAFQAFVRSRFG
jgi:hypothetical protein